MTTKRCSKCGLIKPLTDFHLHRRQKDGHQNFCKECKKYPSTRAKEALLATNQKKCGHCGIIKPIEQFNKEKRRQDGRSPWCKQCKSMQGKVYRDPEKEKARHRNYRRSESSKTNVRHYQQNSDVYKANHRKTNKKYALKYPEKAAAHIAVRQAVLTGKLPSPKTLICSNCLTNLAKHYHHHNGYDRTHWLDVVPLCNECHVIVHHSATTP